MKKWTIDDSRELYNINGWGTSYFGVNDKGDMYVTPCKDNVQIDLRDVMDELHARAIDWDRGNPWVWKYADLEQLKASPCMFARKFDIEKEPELVHEIERLYAPHI